MIRYKKGQRLKVKCSLFLEDATILNLHIPNKIASKIRKQKPIELQRETEKPIGVDLNTQLSITGKSSRQKISQRGFEQYNKLGLMEVHRTLHPTIETKLLMHMCC